MRVLIVSSVGGHLTEVMQLAPLLVGHEVSLVVNDVVALPAFPFKSVYCIAHAERDWRVLLNLAEAARIIQAERPEVVLSAGAGSAVPVAMVAKWGCGARVLFLESAAAVTRPSLTGKLLYRMADRFFYQWPGLARVYPRGELTRVIFP